MQATRILLARQGKLDPIWVARFPETLDDFRTAFFALFDNLDIPHHEIAFFVTRLLALATSCEERFREEYEEITFWDFIGANARSENYRRYLGQGMTRSLVAMRAEESSTRTVGRILLQLFYGILVPGRVFDRLLAGPTNDVWIDPWRTHLTERLGVTLVPNATVRAFNLEGDRIGSVSVERDGQLEAGDCRLPCRRDAGGGDAAASHAGARRARRHRSRGFRELRTEWMNGIQFYLETDRPLADGHAIYLDSNWALTSISQRQFWRGYDLSTYGDGRVGGILSVDISNWSAPGNFNGSPRWRQRRARRSRTKSGRS